MESEVVREVSGELRAGPGFSYFPHGADIGIIASGVSLEEAFVHAAQATFSLMADLRTVFPRDRVELNLKEDDPELALVEWINRLLSEASVRRMIFSRFSVTRDNGEFLGEAWGENWEARHARGIEVKGATLTSLSVKAGPEGWDVRLVVDV